MRNKYFLSSLHSINNNRERKATTIWQHSEIRHNRSDSACCAKRYKIGKTTLYRPARTNFAASPSLTPPAKITKRVYFHVSSLGKHQANGMLTASWSVEAFSPVMAACPIYMCHAVVWQQTDNNTTSEIPYRSQTCSHLRTATCMFTSENGCCCITVIHSPLPKN